MSHAKYAPSAADRWTKCTAAPHLEEHLPDTTSDAADTGTCYHAVAETMLRRLLTPAMAAGDVSKIELRRAFKFAYHTVRTVGTDDVDAETANRLMNWDEGQNHAGQYVQYILDTYGKRIAAGASYGLESKVHVAPGCSGTVDFWCYYQDTKAAGYKLDVVDLKCGRWPVSAEDNPQGKTYALGVINHLHVGWGVPVSLTIYQDGYADVWDAPEFVLTSWHSVLASAIHDDEPETNPGSHCKWCKAKPSCEHYKRHNMELAKTEFAPAAMENPTQTIETMDGETAARMLDAYQQIAAFIDAALPVLTERAYRDGLEVPGYKTVRGVKHKAWNNKEEAEKKLGPKATKSTILTPNQAIKALGEKACAGLWAVPIGEVKLVTLGTRGKPVTASAQQEFAD